MGELNSTMMAVLAGSAVGGAALAVLGSYLVFSKRSKDLLDRLDKADKARARTNDMLMQARRQVEALQKEMLNARPAARPVAAPASAPAAAAPAAAAPAAAPRPAAAGQHPLSQAAQDQAQALARARERAKALLEDELDRTVVLHRPPGGFAETQPLSRL